jgi:hypothetical protein
MHTAISGQRGFCLVLSDDEVIERVIVAVNTDVTQVHEVSGP